MTRLPILGMILLAVVLMATACTPPGMAPGATQDPEVQRIKRAAQVCASLTASLNSLAGLNMAGAIDESEEAAIDAAKAVADPICEPPTPPPLDQSTLEALENASFELIRMEQENR